MLVEAEARDHRAAGCRAVCGREDLAEPVEEVAALPADRDDDEVTDAARETNAP